MVPGCFNIKIVFDSYYLQHVLFVYDILVRIFSKFTAR